jgi:DNA primase large subunit
MRHLHESLKQNHHLKHYGRLQYNLFLKGIGLPVDESLKFFRGEFSKGAIPVDKVLCQILLLFLNFYVIKKKNFLV